MLTIDLETRSDKDITKCGVYPYAESDSFEILLFSYAADDGEVKTIDIAGGEQIPQARDILLHAMQNLSDYGIAAHVHDEVILECCRGTHRLMKYVN